MTAIACLRCFPWTYAALMSYFGVRSNIPCRRHGALANGFFTIASSSLWSGWMIRSFYHTCTGEISHTILLHAFSSQFVHTSSLSQWGPWLHMPRALLAVVGLHQSFLNSLHTELQVLHSGRRNWVLIQFASFLRMMRCVYETMVMKHFYISLVGSVPWQRIVAAEILQLYRVAVLLPLKWVVAT